MKRILFVELMLLFIFISSISFAFSSNLDFINGVGALDSIIIEAPKLEVLEPVPIDLPDLYDGVIPDTPIEEPQEELELLPIELPCVDLNEQISMDNLDEENLDESNKEDLESIPIEESIIDINDTMPIDVPNEKTDIPEKDSNEKELEFIPIEFKGKDVNDSIYIDMPIDELYKEELNVNELPNEEETTNKGEL